ncbi:ATP-binding cassette domain-containing protein [Streptomyces griseocarneus]|uniref:ATP-binding cassette domain-containing protein n=1 Tax=Streptomyces griseocarneus TaxID=51201 RepID=UPI0019B33163|nr:ABC transporter ATP-binding protein [Streptomyces griseocarneus]MBZ6475423.1 ABC transporter ATP-binding protein/permease [Streptomyces griseocarneus]GHG75163.1 multidrug ABC transporter permease [Streptomyces griseocarneus]
MSDADTNGSESRHGAEVPGPRRRVQLPLPPERAMAAPEGEEVGDELKSAYWMQWDGEAARTSVWRILGRLPAISRRVLGLAYRADARATVMVVVLQLASSLMSALGLLASVRVLSALFAQGATSERIHHALPSLMLVAGLMAAQGLLDFGVARGQAALTPKVRRAVEQEFLRLNCHVRLEAVDDAAFADEAHKANDRGLYYMRQAVPQLIQLAHAVLGLIGSAGVLAVLHPVLLPLLLLSVVPQGYAAVRSARAQFLSHSRYSTLQRRIRLFTWILLDRESAPEVRASTAQRALLEEHERFARRIEEEDARLGRQEANVSLWGRAVGGLAVGSTYAVLGWMTATGRLPLAAGGGAFLAIRSSRGTLVNVVLAMHQIYEHALWIDDLERHLERCRALQPHRTGLRLPDRVKNVTVTDVHYAYPETGRDALRGVSMTLAAGSTVAFVGANGSGKSTMAKLLAGLYTPSRGSICWDGVEVREVDAESIQAQVAMVLQDPVAWPLSALANVTIGAGTITEADPQRALAAVTESGADRVIAGLPQQWATPLSKRFKGGQELSGGNWAKVAVARGLYQDAAVLVLDEPTASMDARAEHAVYEAVLHGPRRADRITVLISHRLASVTECDMIYVFRDGRIVESGDHLTLMSRRTGSGEPGEYAQLFTLQAAAYRAAAGAEEET